MVRIGIHGLKRRWVPETLSTGLVRPSAAWFMVSEDATRSQLLTTIAAGVYLAFGRTVPSALCGPAVPGRYSAYLREHRELIPALLVFCDRMTGTETVHRYAWMGESCNGFTAPYTNVGRAGRVIPAAVGRPITVGLDSIAEAERSIDRADADPAWWQHSRPLEKVPAADDSLPPHPAVQTKLSSFCVELGRRLLDPVTVTLSTLNRQGE